MAKAREHEKDTQQGAPSQGEPPLEAGRQETDAQDADGQPEVIQLSKEDFQKVKSHIEGVQKEKDEVLSSSKKLKKNYDKAKAQIKDLEKEKEEAIAVAQRLHADFDNYRKRNASLRMESLEEGRRECVQALLPTLDNFDRAMENSEGVEKGFVEGMQLVQKLLLDTLHKFGLEEIAADGLFDPNLHNAVMQEAAEGKQSGEIVEVLQKGYRMGDRILRHSMVKVAE